MTRADLPAVLAMERDVFGDEAWTEGMFRDELAERGTRHYVVLEEQDGTVLGYAGLCAYPDEAYVQTIVVAPDRWGEGHGTGLLRLLLDEAASRGIDVVGLEVRADNERAQRLYERFGFERIGVRRRYYQPSGVDAVIMQLRGDRERQGQS